MTTIFAHTVLLSLSSASGPTGARLAFRAVPCRSKTIQNIAIQAGNQVLHHESLQGDS